MLGESRSEFRALECEPCIDLETFLAFGRRLDPPGEGKLRGKLHVPAGTKPPLDLNLPTRVDLDATPDAQLDAVRDQLVALCTQIQGGDDHRGFNPSLMEFSFFEPEDTCGSIFYGIFIASQPQQLARYAQMVEGNLAARPLLPNPHLNASPFFSYRESGLDRSARPIVSKTGEPIPVWVCRVVYRPTTSDATRKGTRRDFLEGVQGFLRAAFAASEQGPPTTEVDLTINTSLMIPFARPAASFLRSQAYGPRAGGALFMLGQASTLAGVEAAVAKASHLLKLSVLALSYTEVEVRQEETARTRDLIRHLYHAISAPISVAAANFQKEYERLVAQGADDAELSKIRDSLERTRRVCQRIEVYAQRIEGGEGGSWTRGKGVGDLVSCARGVSESFLGVEPEFELPPGWDDERDRPSVKGARVAWETALWFLLDNAQGALPDPSSDRIRVKFEYAEHCVLVAISNPCEPIAEDRVNRLRQALAGGLEILDRNPSKEASLGLGLVAVGQICRDLEVEPILYPSQDGGRRFEIKLIGKLNL